MKKLGRFEKMLNIFAIFQDFPRFSEFSRFFAKGSLDKKSENLGNSENLENFQHFFKTTQLFHELLREKMSHMLCRCKIIIQIDCAWLELMEINLNHSDRQYKPCGTKFQALQKKHTKKTP